MHMNMHKILLAFACLAHAGDGRRTLGAGSQSWTVKESVRKQPEEALAGLLMAFDSSAAYHSAAPLSVGRPQLTGLEAHRTLDAKMEIKLFDETSLGVRMFNDVVGGIKDLAEKAGVDLRSDDEKAKIAAEKQKEVEKIVKRSMKKKDVNDVSDIDARAQEGKIDFKDFITLAEAYSGLGGQDIPGMPEMTKKEKEELADKFSRHRSIVDVMLEEEVEDPQLLVGEVKEGSGPRIQRLAGACALPETEVAMFVMQFEAMRESTARIAAGEDPDKVEESMSEGVAVNRKQKRSMKKRDKKIKKTKTKM